MEWLLAATILATYGLGATVFAVVLYRHYRSIQHNFTIAVAQVRALEAEKVALVAAQARYVEELSYERSEKQNLLSQIRAAEQQNIILHERHAEVERRMQQWEKTKEESMANAKAAIFEAGSMLAKDLIDKHQQQQETTQKKQEEHLKLTTEQLQQQFQNIVQSVSVLNEEVRRSGEVVDVVRRALLSPTGAGSLAEITLENLLKASGLIEGKDFTLQHTLFSGDGKLRPDALVYLPGGQTMIIDSKASKFFVEIAQAESDEGVLQKKLLQTMYQHMKALADKDYRSAVAELRKDAGKRYISTVMFLPSDGALDTLLQIDSEFMHKAWDNGIFPVGPAGLINILAHARFHIMEIRQTENFNLILAEVGKLIASISTLHDHSARMGKSLQSSMQHYDRFAASFNSTLLQKAKKIQQLGITQDKRKTIDVLPLERYTMVQQEQAVLPIEVTEEELEL